VVEVVGAVVVVLVAVELDEVVGVAAEVPPLELLEPQPAAASAIRAAAAPAASVFRGFIVRGSFSSLPGIPLQATDRFKVRRSRRAEGERVRV
jgi:hypothetical protein